MTKCIDVNYECTGLSKMSMVVDLFTMRQSPAAAEPEAGPSLLRSTYAAALTSTHGKRGGWESWKSHHLPGWELPVPGAS